VSTQPHGQRLGLRWAAATLVVAALPWLASCASTPAVGTLDPGGLDGVFITGLVRVDDSRDIGFGTAMVNNSETESITFGTIELIGAQGIDLVEAFSTSMDHQIGIGVPMPPHAGDDGVPPGQMENWGLRTPLGQTVLRPQEILMLMLVIHPTSADDCLHAQGFRLTYREFGHDLTVVSNMAMILYYDTSGEACSDVGDYLRSHPVKR